MAGLGGLASARSSARFNSGRAWHYRPAACAATGPQKEVGCFSGMIGAQAPRRPPSARSRAMPVVERLLAPGVGLLDQDERLGCWLASSVARPCQLLPSAEKIRPALDAAGRDRLRQGPATPRSAATRPRYPGALHVSGGLSASGRSAFLGGGGGAGHIAAAIGRRRLHQDEFRREPWRGRRSRSPSRLLTVARAALASPAFIWCQAPGGRRLGYGAGIVALIGARQPPLCTCSRGTLGMSIVKAGCRPVAWSSGTSVGGPASTGPAAAHPSAPTRQAATADKPCCPRPALSPPARAGSRPASRWSRPTALMTELALQLEFARAIWACIACRQGVGGLGPLRVICGGVAARFSRRRLQLGQTESVLLQGSARCGDPSRSGRADGKLADR